MLYSYNLTMGYTDILHSETVHVRGSKNWKEPPGSFDPLHLAYPYSAKNDRDIPDIPPQSKDLKIPEGLYPHRFKQQNPKYPALLEFFVDDYHFQSAWNRPHLILRTVTRKEFWGVCTPDFSLWVDMPVVLQLYQTYRNRRLGCFWKAHGVNVIPSVCWVDERSFDFCFEGIAEGQIISHGVPGFPYPVWRETFLDGYREMVRRLKPRHVIAFGKMPMEEALAETTVFPRYFLDRKKQKKSYHNDTGNDSSDCYHNDNEINK